MKLHRLKQHAPSVAMILATTFLIGVIFFVQTTERSRIVTFDQLTPMPIALVLGAPPFEDGQPAQPLQDRLTSAAELYRLKRVSKILISGDDGQLRTPEVPFMFQSLLALGVPSQDIVTDPHGYRTYESCRRAREKFNVAQAIIITQRFHLPRALYLCSRLGLDVQGYAADRGTYKNARYYFTREMLASVKAWLDLNVRKPISPIRDTN